ncbi:MAG TPA: DNA repair protein RecO [Salinimicrobium sp.]|nr:DNA repair protein RecO [Salinimicrobium sp.]
MLITTKAIVFHAIKYGEADLIVKCYTEKAGIRTYLIRGVLKSKKGKLRASLFQPLTQLEIVASHRDKGSMEYLREAKVSLPYHSLHTDVIKSTVVFFLAEMLRNTIVEEESNEALFHFLENSFSWFDINDKPANFHLLFLLRLTKYLGFYPNDIQEEAAFFNLEEGEFTNIKSGEYRICDENLDLLKRLLGINFEGLAELKLNQTRRTGFLLILLDYYELHIQGFRRPKSLSVLNEIFY